MQLWEISLLDQKMRQKVFDEINNIKDEFKKKVENMRKLKIVLKIKYLLD